MSAEERSVDVDQSESRHADAEVIQQMKMDLEEEPSEANLPPVDRGWPAYRFLIASVIVDTFVWGSLYSFGTWQEYYTSNEPFKSSSAVQISSIGTIALALGYGEMLLGILACRRWPHLIRYGIFASLVVYVVALVAASFAQSVGALIVTQGLLAGIAGGFIYAPIYVWLAEWFVKRRALAGGIIFSGAGVGGLVFPLFLNALLPRVGFRWTLRIFAAVQAVCVGVALFGMKPRIPVKSRPVNGTGQNTPMKWSLFWSPVLLLFSAAVFIQGFMFSPVSVYLPTYTASFASTTVASLTLSILNIATVPGQILTGALCDRFSYVKVMLGTTLVAILSVFALLRVSDTAAKVFGFAIMMGMTGGGFSSTWFRGCLDISTEHAGVIFGILSCLRGASAIVGPIIAGLLYNPTGSRQSTSLGLYGFGSFVAFIGFCGVGTVVLTVGVEVARRLRRTKDQKT